MLATVWRLSHELLAALTLVALAGCHSEPFKADTPRIRVVGTADSIIELETVAIHYAGERSGFAHIVVDAMGASVTDSVVSHGDDPVDELRVQ